MVEDPGEGREEGASASAALSAPEKELFQKLEDTRKAEDIEEQARVVQDF